MTAILIAGGIFAALVILGAYLRWAVKPVHASYRIGVDMGRMLQAQKKDGTPWRPRPRPLAVALVWLMPWRAARTIREQRKHNQLLIRTLAYALTGDAGPVAREHEDRPQSLTVAGVLLRPGRAVRRLRSAEDAAAWLLDAILAQERQHQKARELAVTSK